jgi:hypothetical protein
MELVIPLLVIYNATGPAKPLLVDADERFTADRNAKRAIAMFLDHCIGEVGADAVTRERECGVGRISGWAECGAGT